MPENKGPVDRTSQPLPTEELFSRAEAFEREHPEYAEAAKTFDLTMEQYQASLNALYRPTIYSSDSADAGAYGNLE